MAARWDYVIVGAGTAGAVLAARLAGRPGVRVCLLDAGIRRDTSSAAAVAFRPPAEDFRRWEAAGAEGWDPLGIIRAWQKIRNTVDAAEPPPVHPTLEACLAAAEQAGYPETDFLRPFTEGAGWLYHHRRGTLGASDSEEPLAYVESQAPNLRVLRDRPAHRVLFDGARAVGVETPDGPLYAEREVVLCAGAVGSATLLLRSGVGPAEQSRAHGLPVVADLPGVGAHVLHEVACPVRFEPARPIDPVPAGARAAVAFCPTEPDLPVANLWIWFSIERGTAATSGLTLTMELRLAHARTVGALRLNPSGPAGAPRVEYEPLSDPDGADLRTTVAGVEIARRIAAQPVLGRWIERERMPGADARSRGELAAYARRAARPIGTPAGTCRMGAPDDPATVVTPDLRVRGVEGLRVADASVFPELISVEPVTTCMIVAEKCAALLRRPA